VQLELHGVPDSEILTYVRREFTTIFPLELPEESTARLLRAQVHPGTQFEYGLLALRAAVEVSLDAHPDRVGEIGVDVQRRTAIRHFCMYQYPPL
jgi:hypothetical protein